MKKPTTIMAFVATLALALTACSQDASDSETDPEAAAAAEEFTLVEDGTLTVAVSGTPPSFVVSPTGDIDGTVPTILEEFAAQHGLDIKYDQYSFAASIAAVQGSRADISGGAYYTEERANSLLFVQPFQASGSWLVTSAEAEYSEPSDLEGESVGVASGYEQVPYLEETLGSANVTQYESDSSGIQAVKNDRNAAFVAGGDLIPYAEDDEDLALHQMNTGDFGMPAEITEATSNMFVQCGNNELLDALDEFIAEYVQQDEFMELIEEFTIPEVAITDGEPYPDTCD